MSTKRCVPEWFPFFISRLSELEALPDNWDSYGGKMIDKRAVAAALDIATAELAINHLPPPQVVPTPAGGLQLEWHQGGADLEIEVSPIGEIELFFEQAEEDFAVECRQEEFLSLVDFAHIARALAGR